MSPSLPELEAALRRDLELLSYPARAWRTPPATTASGHPILDCLIVGGGQGGLGVAFGLLRERVDNVLVVDQNPKDFAGPWRTFARMITLRTPKHLTGIDYGLPNLTVQAWYRAKFGESAWDELQLIPKEEWAAYLAWYRDITGIPVAHEARVGALEWRESEGCFAAPIERAGGEIETVYARTAVLSTGIEGSGYWNRPELVRGLPDHVWAHTRDDIDFAALAGKRVAVLGAGASAFDNASAALEAGAGEVRLYFRRRELPNVNPYRWAEFVGFLKHHGDLSDAERWRFVRQILRMGQLPPQDTLARARRFDHFHLHPATPWEALSLDGDAVRIDTPQGPRSADFLILGTGFLTDLSCRPELARVHPEIALWQHRYEPPEEDRHDDLLRHPYLGSCFEFRERTPGRAPWVERLFNYTFGCLVSLGFGGASISGMKYSLPKVVYGVTRQLYRGDSGAYFRSLETYDVEEYHVPE